MIARICLAQSAVSSMESEHAQNLQQNPPGITLTIALAEPTAKCYFDKRIRLKLLFSSNKARDYTVELAPGGSAAASSDDLVFEGPEMLNPLHSESLEPGRGVVCCGTNRAYVTAKPIVATAYVTLPSRDPLSDAPLVLFPNRPTGRKPGDYAIYIRTRRLLRGWPKSSREKYFATSDIVVTSKNILQITVMPRPTADEDKP